MALIVFKPTLVFCLSEKLSVLRFVPASLRLSLVRPEYIALSPFRILTRVVERGVRVWRSEPELT